MRWYFCLLRQSLLTEIGDIAQTFTSENERLVLSKYLETGLSKIKHRPKKMSSCDLIFKLEQDTDKLKTVIFRLYFRAIIRPSGLQKLTITRIMSLVINNEINIIGY